MKRWKIRKCHIARPAGPTHALNIDAYIVGPYFRDNGAPGAIIRHPENPEQTVEEPYCAGGEQPVIVEVVAPFEDDVIPAADDDEDSKEDV